MEAKFYKPTEIYFNLFGRLRGYDLIIKKALDIGCNEGAWAKRLKTVYPEAEITMIDTIDSFKKECEQYGKFIQACVGEKEDEKIFYFSTDPMDSRGGSLYIENSNVPWNTKKVQTKALKDIVPNEKFDYIKIDVQGEELDIIRGSLELFQSTKWVQLECPVFENNKGAPKFAQVTSYMINLGFSIFDIENVYYNAKLMSVDFLFCNKNLPKQIPLEREFLQYTHHDK